MVTSDSMARWLIVVASIAFAAGCAQKPWIRAAHSGSLAELQRYVEVAADRKQLDHSQTMDLARALAEREIEAADDNAVFERITALRACASEVFWPLKHRSKRTDDGAAGASLVLFESGLTEGIPTAPEHRDAGAWRAYAIRLAIAPGQRNEVHAALLDPDLRVRSAAMRTIQADPMPTDVPALLDVVRLEPEVSLKQSALLTLGELGNENSLLAAREFWDDMVEATRLSLVQALNAPLARKHGGETLLVRIMESDDSMQGAVAASLLYHDGTASRGYAANRLLRALHEGTTAERLLALSTLPASDREVQEEVQKLAKSNTPYLRTAALEILMKAPSGAAQAQARIREIANSKDADAYEAARILALQGDEASLARVERQLRVPQSDERLGAARLLLKMQRWSGVARALTDDHPGVRLAVACDVLER